MIAIPRPMPPEGLLASEGVAPDLAAAEWLRSTFLDDASPLFNPDHVHLRDASIGVLWHGGVLAKHGRQILGRCELVSLSGDAWASARKEDQLHGWFGLVPDFVVSFDAAWAASAPDIEFVSVADHELCHAGQEIDEHGSPKFCADGRPKWAMRAHDVSEFVSIVRRYGVVSQDVADLVAAAGRHPEISRLNIARACGTCALRAA